MNAFCNVLQRTVWHFIGHVLARLVKQLIVVSSGDDSVGVKWNMQTGKDDEDLQRALALSLEPSEDCTGAEFGLEGVAGPRPLSAAHGSFWVFCLAWGPFNNLKPFCRILECLEELSQDSSTGALELHRLRM